MREALISWPTHLRHLGSCRIYRRLLGLFACLKLLSIRLFVFGFWKPLPSTLHLKMSYGFFKPHTTRRALQQKLYRIRGVPPYHHMSFVRGETSEPSGLEFVTSKAWRVGLIPPIVLDIANVRPSTLSYVRGRGVPYEGLELRPTRPWMHLIIYHSM